MSKAPIKHNAPSGKGRSNKLKVGQKVTIRPKKPGEKTITYKKGGLHASLGVPQGKTIPKSKLRAAAAGKYGPKAKKQALMAEHVFHVKA